MMVQLLLLSSAFAQDELRPLKPTVALPDAPMIWPWLLAVALGGTLAILTWAVWRWWHRVVELTPEEALREGLTSAGERLEAGDVAAAADAVDASVRGFLAARLDGSVLHRTNDELAAWLEPRLPEDVHQPLNALLNGCDAVRFAGADTLDLDLTWVDGLLDAVDVPPADAIVPTEPPHLVEVAS